VLNLGATSIQPVHLNRTLRLNSPMTFENIIGGTGADTLIGNGLSNTLTGGPGDDTLNGASGNDLLVGGPNNDTYVFETNLSLGSDTINESGGGIDTLNFSSTTTRAVTVDLGNAGTQVVNAGLTLTLSSGQTVENVIGSALADSLRGNGLENVLSGGGGNDVLTAVGGSRNILLGGAGEDTLNGASGEDLLLGARSTLETNVVALIALRNEWVSAASFDLRVTHLLGTVSGGLNGDWKLSSTTVKDDAARDLLIGNIGRDWYLRNSLGGMTTQRDVVTDIELDTFFTEIISWL